MNKTSHSHPALPPRYGHKAPWDKIHRTLLLCVLLCTLSFGTSAQELEALLLDYDTVLTVKCSYGTLPKLVLQDYHQEPVNGKVVIWGDSFKHTCKSDNAQAQRIFLARLEKLSSPKIYRHRLSYEAEKIVYNFELITGIPNSPDGDFFGMCYVSHLTRSAWKRWFAQNKERLRYCPQYRVLYVSIVPTSRSGSD